MKFLNFGSIQEDIQGKVKQDLKFKTGKFIWRVRFSAPLDPATVNNKNLYDYLGQKVYCKGKQKSLRNKCCRCSFKNLHPV